MMLFHRGVLSFLLIFFTACATVSGDDLGEGIPKRAQEHLNASFPQADYIEWSNWENQYTCSFFDAASERPVEVIYDQRGRWQETTIGLEWQEVPAPIKQYVTSSFQQYYATAYSLRSPQSDRFGLTVDTPSRIYTLVFSPEGQLLSREEEGIDGG